jgi:hypothetical protein
MARKKSELPKKPAENIQAAVTPTGEALTVALSGTCIGTSSKTFEELITGAFIAALTGGNKTNGQLSDISAVAGDGIIDILNSQTSFLEEIKNSLEKIVNKVASVKTDASSSILNVMEKSGIPVVIVGNEQPEPKEKPSKGADSKLEIILNANTRKNFRELIKDIAKLGNEKLLDDFEKSLKRIVDALENVDKQAKNLENLAGLFGGIAELNKLDVQKLDEFILFIEDLGGLATVTQSLPVATANISEGMKNLLPMFKTIDKVVYITDCLTKVFYNLTIVDKLTPDFDLESIELANAAIGDADSGFTKLVASLSENEEKYKSAHNSVIELSAITGRLLFVGIMSYALSVFDAKNLEPLSGWLTRFDEIALQLSKADGHGGKGSRKLSTTKKTVMDLTDLVSAIVTLGKISNKIPEFDPEKWTKINEFIKKLSDAENEESLIGIITSAQFDEKTIEKAKKNLDGLRSIVMDVFLLGLLSILIIPLAALAIGGMLALTLFGKVSKGLVTTLSGNEISIGLKGANTNIQGFGTLLIASTFCMLIGGYFVTKHPALILGALGFGIVLGLFIFTVIGAVALGTLLMRGEGGLENLKELGLFVAMCGLILLVGGTIMAFFPGIILGSFAFALALGLFLFLIIGAVSLGGAFVEGYGEKYVESLQKLIISATIVMVVGALLYMFAPQVLSAAMHFALYLGAFLFVVVMAITLPGMLCNRAAASVRDLHKLILASTLVMVIGGLLIMYFPQLVLSSIFFGLALGLFIFVVLKAITSQSKKIRRAKSEIWSIIAIVGASALVLLIAGGIIAAVPAMAWTIPLFIVCMTGMFFALGFLADYLSKKGKQFKQGLIALAAITGIVLLSTFALKMLANVAETAPMGKLVGCAIIISLVVAIFGAMAIGIGAVISSGIGGAAIAGGVAAMAAIVGIVCLAAVAVGLIADNLKKWEDTAQIKFGDVIKNLGIYIVMLGMMQPIAVLSLIVGLAIPGITATGFAFMLIKKSLSDLGGMGKANVGMIKNNIKAFIDMAWELVPLGRPSIAFKIVLASAAASSLRYAISNIAAGVQEMASLKVPIYEGTKTVGYRQLNNSDFKSAAKNISLIVSTLGDTMITLYNTRPDMFKANLFTGKTPFSIVCSSVSQLGSVIAKIAAGVQSYASLKVAEYEGEKIVGYKQLKNEDFKNAANNISLIITTLAGALIKLYNDNPLMFQGSFFNSNNTPLNRVITSTKELGGVMSNIAFGVQAWADLKAPIEWNAEGKPTKFEKLKKGFELDAAANVSTIIKCLFNSLIGIHNENPELFKGSLFNSNNTPVNRVIRSASELGKILSSLAQGIQAWANMTIPLEWNESGAPTKFKRMSLEEATLSGQNAASIITSLFNALTSVYNANPSMFKGSFFRPDNTPINKVVTSAKELGEITSGLAKGIQQMAVMTYVSEYDSKTGKPLKTVRVGNEEVLKAGINTGTIITTLFTALNNIYKQNPSFFSNGEDSIVFTVIKSVKNVSGAISGIASAIKMIATTQVPTKWDKDGKPIAFENLSQKHFDLAAEGVAKIVSTLGGAILDLASNPATAKYFEVGEGNDQSPFNRVLNSVQGLGKLIGNIADGIKKYAELKVPTYDAKGKITGYQRLKADDFLQAGINVGLIVTTLATSLFTIYQKHPEWFGDEILSTILDSVRNMGEVVSVVAESVAAIATLSIPIGWDKSGKPNKFKLMKNEDFIQAGVNIQTIISTIGKAMTDMYNSMPQMFAPIDPKKPNGDTPFEKVAMSCQSLGEMIKSIAEGIEYFGTIWGKKLPNGGKIDASVIKAAGDNIAEICVTIGRAISKVYHLDKSMFELPPLRNETVEKNIFGGVKSRSVTYTPNPADPPFLKVIKSCGAMGQLIADLAVGINEFATIYSKKLPDGSTINLSLAAKNIAEIILCVGHSVASVYNRNSSLFDSRRDGTSPFAKVTNGVLDIVSGLGGLTNIIGSYASGEFPLLIDKDGNVKSTIKINFESDSKKIQKNIEAVINCLFTAVRSAARTMPNVSTSVFDSVKVHGQKVSDAMKILCDMVVSYASLKIPTGFDNKGKILGYKQLDAGVFANASLSMMLIINGVTNVLNTTMKFFNSNNLFGKSASNKLNTSLNEIIKTFNVMNKQFDAIIKEVLRCPDSSNLEFSKLTTFTNKMNELMAILRPFIIGTEKSTSILGMNFTRTVDPEILDFKFKKVSKFIDSLTNINTSIRHIMVQANKFNAYFKSIQRVENIDYTLITGYLNEVNNTVSTLNDVKIKSIKERRWEDIKETIMNTNRQLFMIGINSRKLINLFNFIADTSVLDYTNINNYFDNIRRISGILKKSAFLIWKIDGDKLINKLMNITKVCVATAQSSKIILENLNNIVNIDEEKVDTLKNFFDITADINKIMVKNAILFNIVDTNLNLGAKLKHLLFTLNEAIVYASACFEVINKMPQNATVDLAKFNRYFDKMLAVNTIMVKSALLINIIDTDLSLTSKLSKLFKTLVGAKLYANLIFTTVNKITEEYKEIDLTPFNSYLKNIEKISLSIKIAELLTFNANSKKFNNKLKEMTNICFGVFSASTYLDIILNKIVIIDDETIDNVQSSLKQIRNLHWLITKESVKFEVLDTKLSLISHLREMTKTFYDMFKYSAIIFSYVENVYDVSKLDLTKLNNYFDKCAEINYILFKNSIRLNLLKPRKMQNEEIRAMLSGLDDVYRFGNALAGIDVSSNYDNIIEAVEKISKATGKDVDDKRLDRFRKQNKELEKFVKTVNSIKVSSTDKLTQLLVEFNKLGLNMTNMEKLVEAITMHLSKELFNLSEELDKVGKVIAKESDRKEKRKRIVEQSVEDVKDLINRELTVIVKKEQTTSSSSGGSGGGSGSGDSGSGNSGGITVKGENVTVQGYGKNGGKNNGANH